jgi:hypothetical protein
VVVAVKLVLEGVEVEVILYATAIRPWRTSARRGSSSPRARA